MAKIFQDRIYELESLGILFVIPAGNEGFDKNHPEREIEYLGDSLPTVLGTDDNNVVTVGAVQANGKYAPWTTPEGSSDDETNSPLTGSITVWAQGEVIQIMDQDNKNKMDWGTSFASPQVAGLIAYILSLPENSDLVAWDPNGPDDQGYTLSQKVKKKLVDMSYERVVHSRQLGPGINLPYPLPAHIKVAYNGAWGPQFGSLPLTWIACW